MGLLRFPFANELSPLPDGPMTQWASGIGFSFFFFLGRVVSAFLATIQVFRAEEEGWACVCSICLLPVEREIG